MIRSIPLHSRLVLPFVFLMVTSVVVIGLMLKGPLTDSMFQLFQKQLESGANTAGVLILETGQEMRNFGVGLAYSKTLLQSQSKGYLKPEEIATRIKNGGGQFLAFGDISLLPSNAQLEDFQSKARTQGDFSVPFLYKEKPIILVFISIRIPDRPDRLLTIGVPMDQPFMDKLSKAVGFPVAIGDATGHVVALSSRSMTLFPKQFAQETIGGVDFSDGQSYLWMKRPLPGYNPLGLEVILATSSKPLDEVFLQILQYWVLAAVGLLLLGSGIYFWLVKTIVRPLNQLVYAAEEVASGNLHVQVSDHNKDEVGRLSNAFNKMTAGLQEVDRVKGAFLAYISHELRTPLTSIVGFAKRIPTIGDQKIHKIYEAAAIIEKEGSRMIRLVEDLLFLGSVEAGKIQWQFVPFQPYSTIQSCVEVMIPLAEEKGLSLTLTGTSDLPETIGDSDRIKQAVLNLLSNAIAYSNKGFIQVEVSMDVRDQSWSIVVSDTGVGLDAISPVAIFDPFVRGHKDSKGSGIGLSLVKEVMNAHGGTVTCTPNQPEGLRFTLYFPPVKMTKDLS